MICKHGYPAKTVLERVMKEHGLKGMKFFRYFERGTINITREVDAESLDSFIRVLEKEGFPVKTVREYDSSNGAVGILQIDKKSLTEQSPGIGSIQNTGGGSKKGADKKVKSSEGRPIPMWGRYEV